uniref:Uncharacterized protein n=2 Tax=Plectus sambesii TaxID=2011161 RepID=A0A914WQR8_9BILA
MVLLSGCLEDSMSETRKSLSEAHASLFEARLKPGKMRNGAGQTSERPASRWLQGKNIRDLSKATAEDAVKDPTPNDSCNAITAVNTQSTAPALYRTRSVDSLTSFDESDSDAAQNVYRGNQCCAVQQMPTQGNEEEKRNDIKAWPGIAKKKEMKNEEMCNDKKRRSQKIRDAGRTSKTTTLEGLYNPTVESAKMKMAPQQKKEAASERAS